MSAAVAQIGGWFIIGVDACGKRAACIAVVPVPGEDGRWHVLRFTSAEQGRQFFDGMREFERWVATLSPAERKLMAAELIAEAER